MSGDLPAIQAVPGLPAQEVAQAAPGPEIRKSLRISRRFRPIALTILFALLFSCGGTGDSSSFPEHSFETLGVLVLDTLPHDTTAFTQGFEIHEGILWESTGLYGLSDLRMIDPLNGSILDKYPLPDSLFGEGITIIQNQVFQLTWLSGLVLSWNLHEPEPVIAGTIETQGWGICSTDNNTVVTSNGSSLLSFRNLSDFSTIRTVIVTLDNVPQIYLNELEYTDGCIYANQWNSDRILRIDPESGYVNALIDASDLLSNTDLSSAGVLNGIAWDPERQAFLLTGKYWPFIFVVRFEPII